MNPHKFSDFCIKKQSQKNKNYKKLFVEKQYYKFHSYFFTLQWLTKYIFSSINTHTQAPNFF